MTPDTDLTSSAIWSTRRLLSRVGLTAATVLLVTGLAMAMLGRGSTGAAVLGWACALLVGIPILNMTAVLAEEIRRRDWRFAAVAGVVMVLLAYAVMTRVLMGQ